MRSRSHECFLEKFLEIFSTYGSSAREAFDEFYPPEMTPVEQNARAIQKDWEATLGPREYWDSLRDQKK